MVSWKASVWNASWESAEIPLQSQKNLEAIKKDWSFMGNRISLVHGSGVSKLWPVDQIQLQQAHDGFCIFKWLKKMERRIMFYEVKIMWNSSVSVHKRGFIRSESMWTCFLWLHSGLMTELKRAVTEPIRPAKTDTVPLWSFESAVCWPASAQGHFPGLCQWVLA